MNYYNGAGSGETEVVQWLTDGADMLDTYDGNGVGDPLIPSDNPDRDDAILLAEHLEMYNDGNIGPGPCQ